MLRHGPSHRSDEFMEGAFGCFSANFSHYRVLIFMFENKR